MKTSTIVTVIVIIILVIAGLIFVTKSADVPGDTNIPDDTNLPVDNVDTTDPLAAAFRDELTKRAIENMGGMMPIEGFDADLLLGAYEGGLVAADFDRVESFEGVYRLENGTLRHERTVEQPITSAERTISGAGYETLLENVSERLNIEIANETDATNLVDQLDQN